MHDNRFEHNWGTASYGLLLKEIYDAEITNNVFEQNTIGISVDGSTRINYTNNTFSRNGWAVTIIGACYENVFSRNNFLNNAFVAGTISAFAAKQNYDIAFLWGLIASIKHFQNKLNSK